MKSSRHHWALRLQSLLCVLLVINLHWLHGCGQAGFGIPTTAGAFQIPLTESHPLTEALRGTAFQGAVMMEVFPQAQSFRLVFPDDHRQVSGIYSFQEEEFTITQFSFKIGAKSATLAFDSGRRIVTITSSDGQSWTRPIETITQTQSSLVIASGNRYADANRDILEVAARIEQQGANSSSTGIGSPYGGGGGSSGGDTQIGPKPGAQGVIDNVGVILAVIAIMWAPLAGIIGPLVTIFTVTSVLENALVLRFDGTWRASNANSNMLVTISSGKIARLVDESSQQELSLVDSRVREITGNRVVWTVLANVLGNSTEVEFTFDVQELADGTLQGTLTALGNSFARVAVTMTRS